LQKHSTDQLNSSTKWQNQPTSRKGLFKKLLKKVDNLGLMQTFFAWELMDNSARAAMAALIKDTICYG